MSGYNGQPIAIHRCAHGRSQYERCAACDDEREAARIAERRRVSDPAQAILDALAARRQWFDVCAFCAPTDDALHAHERHAPDCAWVRWIADAAGEGKTT